MRLAQQRLLSEFGNHAWHVRVVTYGTEPLAHVDTRLMTADELRAFGEAIPRIVEFMERGQS